MLKGRIKQVYRRNTLILLSGMEFYKDKWIEIPPNKANEARKSLADILDFDESFPPEEGQSVHVYDPAEFETVVGDPDEEEPEPLVNPYLSKEQVDEIEALEPEEVAQPSPEPEPEPESEVIKEEPLSKPKPRRKSRKK